MKTAILFIFLFCFIGSAQSQDYDNMIVRVEGTNLYFRFDPLPISLCTYGELEEWNESIDSAVAEINQYVPIQRAADNCDIEMNIVSRLPSHCNYGDTWGCTNIDYRQDGDSLQMISTVYILEDRPGRLFLLLHEMLHAMGIVGHSQNRNDIMFPVVQQETASLSSSDVAILQYLYKQQAFH